MSNLLKKIFNTNENGNTQAAMFAISVFIDATKIPREHKLIKYMYSRMLKEQYTKEYAKELFRIDFDSDNIENPNNLFSNSKDAIYGLYGMYLLEYWVKAYTKGFFNYLGRFGAVRTGNKTINKVVIGGIEEFVKSNIEDQEFIDIVHSKLSPILNKTTNKVETDLEESCFIDESPMDEKEIIEENLLDLFRKMPTRIKNTIARITGNESTAQKLFRVADRLGLEWSLLKIILQDTKTTRRLAMGFNRSASVGATVISQTITDFILRMAIRTMTNKNALKKQFVTNQLAGLMSGITNEILRDKDLLDNIAVEMESDVMEVLNSINKK